jgi:hypothetical protein
MFLGTLVSLPQATSPTIVLMSMLWMASRTFALSDPPAWVSAATATSNNAWLKPTGWVHCLLVVEV